jgi:hypothetical protein
MQKPSPEALPEFSLAPRQLEIFKLYCQRMSDILKKLRSEHKSYSGLTPGRPWPEIEKVEEELILLGHLVATSADKKIKLSKMLGFWFVDTLQSDIDSMLSVPEATFTHIPRRDMRSHKIEATFYELLYLFYQLGAPFIRTEGADAMSKYYESFKQME